MSKFTQLMKARESWQKAYDREVKLRYKLQELEKGFDLPRNTARVEEYNGKMYAVTVDRSSYSDKIVITEVSV